jgi:hypothetical protein
LFHLIKKMAVVIPALPPQPQKTKSHGQRLEGLSMA